MPERIIRKPELLARIPGKFPKRISLGAKSTGWLESEIDAWIKSKSEGRMKNE
jgi:predicted DNA-binding transcriptional regulator AlpA